MTEFEQAVADALGLIELPQPHGAARLSAHAVLALAPRVAGAIASSATCVGFAGELCAECREDALAALRGDA